MPDSLDKHRTENILSASFSDLHNSMIKHKKYPALWRKRQLYWYYRRLGYYAPYFSGRRGTRLRKFFFYRRRTKRRRLRLKLVFYFFRFLKNHKRYAPKKFLKIKSLMPLFIDFCIYQFSYFRKKKKKFFWLRGKLVTFIYWIRFLSRLHIKTNTSARYFLPSAFFFFIA